MSFLQHDTADKNDVWNLRSPIYFRTNQHENLLVTYLCNEMSLFCYIARSSYRRHSVSFTWQLIWGNIIFVSVVAWITTLNFCASDCANETQNNYIIPFFLIWLLQSYEKKSSSRTVNDNVPLINHLNNSIVCFHYHLHCLRCLQRSQAQQRKFCTCGKPKFTLNKKIHSNVE